MNREEFKENIEGIFIELTETKKAELIIAKHFIRLYRFNDEISDYILTLYDYLEQSGFTELVIEYWSAGGSKYIKLSKSDIPNIIRMKISDIVINFKDTFNIIDDENFGVRKSRGRYIKSNENKFENIKDIITNIEGLLIELKDLGIPYKISPNDDIKIKMVSLGKENIVIDVGLKDFKKSLHIISTLVDYMTAKNFKLLPIRNLYTQGGSKDFDTFEDLVILYNRFSHPSGDQFIRSVRNSIRLEFENMDKIISESLPKQQTVDQLKKLRKLTKGIDIGDRISDMNKQGANIDYINNPIDTGIESFEDYEKKNKKFIPSWNLKHLLDPFQHAKKKKKKNKKK